MKREHEHEREHEREHEHEPCRKEQGQGGETGLLSLSRWRHDCATVPETLYVNLHLRLSRPIVFFYP